ncbi:hypothetical protein ACOJ08_04195, partial [Ornithinimicrobium sp. Y1847]
MATQPEREQPERDKRARDERERDAVERADWDEVLGFLPAATDEPLQPTTTGRGSNDDHSSSGGEGPRPATFTHAQDASRPQPTQHSDENSDGDSGGGDGGDGERVGGESAGGGGGPVAGPDPVAVAIAGLEGLGLDAGSAARWVGAISAQVAADGTETDGVPVPATAGDVLDGMAAMRHAQCELEAALLVSTQDLVMAAGSTLLGRRGVDDPRALSKSAHQSWRAETKAAVAGEVSVLSGIGIWQARQQVALATVPGTIRSHLLGALRRGEIVRQQAITFQAQTRALPVDQTARVSLVMFGTDKDVAAVER